MAPAARHRIAATEVEIVAIRAQGPGGQNVNKVANAARLRFVIATSSLPAAVKARLAALPDRRVGADGAIVIRAQRYRSLEQNRDDALARLAALIARAADVPLPRKATRPTAGAKRRRVDDKVQRGQRKSLRGKVVE